MNRVYVQKRKKLTLEAKNVYAQTPKLYTLEAWLSHDP